MQLADRILGTDDNDPEPTAAAFCKAWNEVPWSTAFAVQLAQRLRDRDPNTTPALHWLNERLKAEGTTTDQIVREEVQRQSAMNVTVRNVITSMRLISIDQLGGVLRKRQPRRRDPARGSDFAAMDFPTRDLYRRAIEELARDCGRRRDRGRAARGRSGQARQRQARRTGRNVRRESDPGYYLIARRPARASRQNSAAASLGDSGFFAPVRDCGVMSYVGDDRAAHRARRLRGLVGVTSPASTAGSWLLAGSPLPASFPHPIWRSRSSIGSSRSRSAPCSCPDWSLRDGVPADLRTMVVVPTLLDHRRSIDEQIERLEVHYLANSGRQFHVRSALRLDGLACRAAPQRR